MPKIVELEDCEDLPEPNMERKRIKCDNNEWNFDNETRFNNMRVENYDCDSVFKVKKYEWETNSAVCTSRRRVQIEEEVSFPIPRQSVIKQQFKREDIPEEVETTPRTMWEPAGQQPYTITKPISYKKEIKWEEKQLTQINRIRTRKVVSIEEQHCHRKSVISLKRVIKPQIRNKLPFYIKNILGIGEIKQENIDTDDDSSNPTENVVEIESSEEDNSNNNNTIKMNDFFKSGKQKITNVCFSRESTTYSNQETEVSISNSNDTFRFQAFQPEVVASNTESQVRIIDLDELKETSDDNAGDCESDTEQQPATLNNVEDENVGYNVEDENVGYKVEDENVGFNVQDENVGYNLEDENVGYNVEDENVGYKAVFSLNDTEKIVSGRYITQNRTYSQTHNVCETSPSYEYLNSEPNDDYYYRRENSNVEVEQNIPPSFSNNESDYNEQVYKIENRRSYHQETYLNGGNSQMSDDDQPRCHHMYEHRNAFNQQLHERNMFEIAHPYNRPSTIIEPQVAQDMHGNRFATYNNHLMPGCSYELPSSSSTTTSSPFIHRERIPTEYAETNTLPYAYEKTVMSLIGSSRFATPFGLDEMF